MLPSVWKGVRASKKHDERLFNSINFIETLSKVLSAVSLSLQESLLGIEMPILLINDN